MTFVYSTMNKCITSTSAPTLDINYIYQKGFRITSNTHLSHITIRPLLKLLFILNLCY